MTASMARTMIVPAALEYQLRIAQTIATTKQAVSGISLTHQEDLLKSVSDKVGSLQVEVDRLESLIKEGHQEEHGDHGESDTLNRARFYEQKVIPSMNQVRNLSDELETTIDDSLWPLPKFREMLYIY
jgi:glutamine synthetase